MIYQCFIPRISSKHRDEDHKFLEKVKIGKKSTFLFEWDYRTWSQLFFSAFTTREFCTLEGKCMSFHWFLVITMGLIKALTDGDNKELFILFYFVYLEYFEALQR